MDESEKRFKVLAELYSELRSYRDKEFNTFIFTFPILGIGLIPKVEIPNLVVLISLTTIFGITMVRYLYKNHYRMLKIKQEIFNIQELEGLNVQLTVLKPKEWVNKSTENHLGTWTYIGILVLEIITTWCFYIWFFLNN